MDANEIVAAAERAAVDLVEQAAGEAGPSKRSSSTKTDLGSGANGASKSAMGRQRNGAAKADSDAGGAHNNGEQSSAVGDVASDEEVEEGAYISDTGAGEMSFVIDTAGDMDVDREIALDDEAKAEHADTHVEGGLLLPTHVNVIPQNTTTSVQASGNSSPKRDLTADDDEELFGGMGDFEQLDMDPSTANRYYGAEEKAERRAKEQCLACGELGHDRRHCPHQHCLACGAMDDHPTRFCPMSTSCFRCGGMGHQTRTCPKPRRGPKNEECERCGSYTHVKALCPTLWRVYTYSAMDEVDRFRAKVFFKVQGSSTARNPRRDLEPDPAELSDSEDEFVRAGEPELPTGSSQFDPATRWCYNCSSSGNHWGDDCPEPRCNPTRGTGEPSAFSEFVSRLGPFAKLVPGAPPLAGFQMPSSQFTFSVGSGATMHVAGEGRGTPNAKRGQSGSAVAIGRHFLASPTTAGRASGSRAGSSGGRGADGAEDLVSFDRTKAIAVDGGFLTRKEKEKGKKPLPEYIFREWVRDRQAHPEYAVEIRSAFEKRAELEAKGLDTKDVPTTRDIVGGKRSKSKDARPSKRRRGGTADDPVVLDSDGESFRDDFSDSDSGSRRKRRGDGKNNRWAHNGDGRGSNRDSGKAFKGGRFSSKRQEDKGKVYEGGGGKKKGRRGGGGGGGGGGASSGKGKGGGGSTKSNRSGGSGGAAAGKADKVRGGGSKYRGSYF